MDEHVNPSWSYPVGLTTTKMAGGGRILVSSRMIICELGKLNARLSGFRVVQSECDHIDIYVARLVPFWMNVGFNVADENHRVRASMWMLGLRQLKWALKSAGIEPLIHWTWLHRGDEPREFRKFDLA